MATCARHNLMSLAPILRAALAIAEEGFTPIPLRGCRPCIKRWPEAEPGLEAARYRFLGVHADGLAVLTNARFFVLDADVRGGGLSTIQALERELGPLPEGPRVRTPSGGLHLWLLSPTDVISSRVRVLPGVDVRGVGGCAVCPPTIRAPTAFKSGGAYVWLCGGSPQVAPEWLTRRLVRARAQVRSSPATMRSFEGEHRWVAAGFAQEMSRFCAMAPDSGRNAMLFKIGARFFGYAAAGHIRAQRIEQALFDGAVANGLVGEDGERAVRATIASGKRRGFSAPRDPPSPERAARSLPGSRCSAFTRSEPKKDADGGAELL